jgi:hypothetical protein
MGVLQLLKTPYVAVSDLLLHLKILHNIILLKLPLLKILHLHKLFSIIRHHMLLLQSLLHILPLLLFKIQYQHNLLSIIL